MWSYLFVFLLSFLFHLSLVFSGSLPLSCFPVFHTLKGSGKEINGCWANTYYLHVILFLLLLLSMSPDMIFFCHVLLVSIVSQRLVQKLKVKWNCWQIESTAKHATDSEGRKPKYMYATGKTPVKAFWYWKIEKTLKWLETRENGQAVEGAGKYARSPWLHRSY